MNIVRGFVLLIITGVSLFALPPVVTQAVLTAEISVTDATVHPKTHVVTVTGMLTCSAPIADAFVRVELYQQHGPKLFISGGDGTSYNECGPFSVSFFADDAYDPGREFFVPGPAEVYAEVEACAEGYEECAFDSGVFKPVQLRPSQ
jgi:hypothetical protein